MAADANIVLQTLVSRSTTLSSTGVSIGSTPRRGLKAHVIYTAADATMSGSGTVTWSVDACYDGVPTTYFQVASGAKDIVTATTTQTGGEVFIPFEVSPSNPANPVFVRLVATVAGLSGSGATIVYKGDVLLGRPA